MNQTSMPTSKQVFVFLAPLLLGGSALFSRPARAIVPCTPPLCASEYTQLMNNIELVTQYAKQVEQYKQQVEQYQTQLKQYQQMYVKGTAYKATPGFRENIESQFPERPIDQAVDESCGTAPKENPVGTTQGAYCVATIKPQNRRYNAMRSLLKDVAKNDADLAVASSEREKIQPEDQGALQANTNKIAAINSKMQNDVQNARYTMDAYNSALATLNDDMVRSANAALKNQNGLLGTVVQGATLHQALRAARRRDR
jgi:DNA repair exonuclease SbcCD ATPase subunit